MTPVSVISKKSVTYLNQSLATLIDQELFTKFGFKVEQLMELAGLAAAQAVCSHYPKGKVVILCGPGNNGGDGFVCARHLQQFGYQPSVVYPRESKNELMKSLVLQCTASDIPVTNVLPDLTDFNLVVDAIFGFSFKPPIREPFGQIITEVKKSGLKVFSIDIPSGWDVETGPIDGENALVPHGVISLTLPKKCMFGWTGPHFLGGRFIPEQLVRDHGLQMPKYPGFSQIVKIDDFTGL